jgi:hypothetical protein
MAIVNNQTYTGKQAEEFYTAALQANKTWGNVRVMPGIKNGMKLNPVSFSNVLTADACGFEDAATITVNPKTVAVCDLKINLEDCYQTFEQMWLSEKLRAGAQNGLEIPATFEEFIVTQIIKRAGREAEELFWNGDTAGSPEDLCNGLLTKFKADATVVDVTGTTLTTSNIVAEIGKGYAAIPNEVRGSEDLRIFLNSKTAALFKQKLAETSLEVNVNKNPDLNFIDVPMVVVNGIPDNEYVIAEISNLWWLTDLEADYGNIRLISLYETLGESKFRLVGRMKHGADYGFGSQIVYYWANN